MIPLREDGFDSHSKGSLENQGLVDLVVGLHPLVDLLDVVVMGSEEGTGEVVGNSDIAGAE
jgi:hypothetical protein